MIRRLRRLWLFMGIVWRPWEEDYRTAWRTAWVVSGIVWGPRADKTDTDVMREDTYA